jgi:hypothetical protein
MLHQTLSKGWCRHGSGLLLGLIVRAPRRLVDAQPRFAVAQNRSSCPAQRSGSPHPGHPRPVVAPLPQRERLLALRLGASASLLPCPLFAEPVQGRRIQALEPEMRELQLAFARELAEPLAVYRVMDTTLVPAIVRVRASRKGHFFCGQATFGRSASKTEWVYGFKAALVAATPKNDSRRAWSKADRRWASFARQAPDHRRGHRPAQGFLLSGASPCEDARRAAGSSGGQGRRVHLRPAHQRHPGRPLPHLADLLI